MNSHEYQSQSSRVTPRLEAVTESEVFEHLKIIKSDSSVADSFPNETAENPFLYLDDDFVLNLNVPTKLQAFLDHSMANDAVKRTPSPILLKYCKQILQHTNILVRPIHIDGEPSLSKEDLELLTQIIKSNESHHCLDEKDVDLLKSILELNSAHQQKDAEEPASRCSSFGSESQAELLESLFFDEADSFDEVEFSWAIVDEIFSRKNDLEEKQSSESVSVANVFEATPRPLMSARTLRSESKDTNTFMDNPCLSCFSVLSEILEEEIMNTTTMIGAAADVEDDRSQTRKDANNERVSKWIETNCFPQNESGFMRQEADMSLSRQGDTVEKVVSPINYLEDKMDCFYNEIDSDIELPSGASTPVPPPSMNWLDEMEQPTTRSLADRFPLTPIPEVPSILSNQEKYSWYQPIERDEDLYTDQVLKKSEQKLLDAINAKISHKVDLPMTLTVKPIKMLDVRRRKQEFYAVYVEFFSCQFLASEKPQGFGICEEYEIKHLTFEELIATGKFYKIDRNMDETILQLMRIDEITFNPEMLLDILQPPRKPTLSGKLTEKIRSSYDSRKYEDLLEEDGEQGLYSARSYSDAECLRVSNAAANATDASKLSNDAHAKTVGVLNDDDEGNPESSSQSKNSNGGEPPINKCTEKRYDSAFSSLLEDIFRIDPDTILDLQKYIPGIPRTQYIQNCDYPAQE